MTKQLYSTNTFNVNKTMIDPNALSVIKELQKHHFQAYIVGGGIRDLILGFKPKDFDIATDATPEQVKKIFNRNAIIIGRRFKIVHVFYHTLNQARSEKHHKKLYDRHILEISTFRSNQQNVEKNIHGRVMSDNFYGTIDEDAKRRDFTINALYYDPIAETIIDYSHGIQDIQAKTINIIGKPQERYIEDPVRILRAIRLADKLNLGIDDNTRIPFQTTKHLLQNEPKGRLFEEMLKILQSGSSANVIKELKELKISKNVFPLFEVDNIIEDKSLAQLVLQKTDERIKNNEDISIPFVLAGILWSKVEDSWNHYKSFEKYSNKEALLQAISSRKWVLFDSGITQYLYNSIKEIWMLQYDLENPNLKKLESLLANNRLRQAWHLYNLRNTISKAPNKLFLWWDSFMDESIKDKTDLLIQLVDLAPSIDEVKRKKRKRKKRNKNKNLVSNDN